MSAELPIIQYWHEDEPPDFISELLGSFDEHNPGSEHLVFSASSAEELIAAHHGDRAVAAFRSCKLPAMQADYFRYCAVHAIGGIYVDADYRCEGNMAGLVDRTATGALYGETWSRASPLEELFAWPYPVGPVRFVANGVFGVRDPGHPLPGLAMELATKAIECRFGNGPSGLWLATGPGVFTSLYLLHELGSIDAFATYAAGSVLGPIVPVVRSVIDGPSAVQDAFEGVELRSLDVALGLISEVKPPGYRKTYWITVARDLYQ